MVASIAAAYFAGSCDGPVLRWKASKASTTDHSSPLVTRASMACASATPYSAGGRWAEGNSIEGSATLGRAGTWPRETVGAAAAGGALTVGALDASEGNSCAAPLKPPISLMFTPSIRSPPDPTP